MKRTQPIDTLLVLLAQPGTDLPAANLVTAQGREWDNSVMRLSK